MKVLIVEDNEILSNNISKYLNLKDFATKQIFDGNEVMFEITSNNYDLIILDLGLPNIDGVEICKNIRNSGKNIPILILTSRNTINDKITGFKSGADDYLVKPFNYEELLLRIEALIRRNYSIKSDNIKINDIEIDIERRKVFKDRKEINLTKLEINLLIYLVQNKTKVISKEALLEKVWGEYDEFSLSRRVDIHVGYLRKKLGKDLIETIRGEGYIIN